MFFAVQSKQSQNLFTDGIILISIRKLELKKKVIPDCKSRAEAYAFISSLPDLDRKKVLLKDIAKDMFIPGSNHVERLSEHGRNLTFETLQRHRGLLDKIVTAFGEMELKDITPVRAL